MSKLPIPRDVLSQHVAILGKTRSGKSSVMRLLVEDLLERKQPVCIVDPKGDWWGIKLAADGKGPGYSVVIFGGEHADIPITESNGAEVAELFATGNRPCLIDLGGWMVGPRTRFWIDFASTLFKLTKGNRWLAVDEFHNFAPKGSLKGREGDMAKALHWSNRLASEGLGKGLALLFASQRPQKVHNDSLTSAETLIAMRVLHPSDRGAVSDWIKGCGDSDGSQVINSLAQMERGEGWAWSPEIGFGPKRVKFPMFRTYDSFRAQTAEDARKLKGWAEVDLDEVKLKFAATIEKAKAEDPKELRRRIAALEKDLRSVVSLPPVRTAPASIKEVRVEVPVLKDAQLKRFESAVQAMAKVGERQSAAGVQLIAVATDLVQALGKFSGNGHKAAPVSTRLSAATARPATSSPPRDRPVVQPRVPRQAGAEGDLKGPERRILNAIAWLEGIGVESPEQPAVAFLAGYTYGGGAFNNPRGRLNQLGLVQYQGDRIRLTDAGRELAEPPPDLLTTDELQRMVLSRLPGPEQRLLGPLLAAYPESMSNEELAAAANYTPGAGAFNNPRGRLRSLGLIEYPEPGRVIARPLLFPGG